MAKKKITGIVADLLADFMTANGYELYNTEFVKEGPDWFLRVYVDLDPAKPSQAADAEQPQEGERYIGTEDCEKVSRFLSEKLDEADPIEQNYYLEVSSPGMDRPLITPEHYRRYLGHEVETRLYKGKDGTKSIEGVLESFEEDGDGYSLTIRDHDDKVWELKLDEVAKTRLAVVF